MSSNDNHDADPADELFIEDLDKVAGGRGRTPGASYGTTLAVGEEGSPHLGVTPKPSLRPGTGTTLAVGEEGGY